jgi:hypothetical protein
MNKTFVTLAIMLLSAGCLRCGTQSPFGDCEVEFDAPSAALGRIDPMFDLKIPRFAVQDASTDAALQNLVAAWRRQAGQPDLPVTLSPGKHNADRQITFSAKDLRVRELLYIIASLSKPIHITSNRRGTRKEPNPKRLEHLFVFHGFTDK